MCLIKCAYVGEKNFERNSKNFNNFVTLANTRFRLLEDDADVLKPVRVLTIYKMLLIYILCVCWSG